MHGRMISGGLRAVGWRRAIACGLFAAALGWRTGLVFAQAAGADSSGIGGPAAATSASLAKEYIENFAARQRLEAQAEFRQREVTRLDAARQAGAVANVAADLKGLSAEARTIVGEVLTSNNQPVVMELDRAAAATEGHEKVLLADWIKVRTGVNDARLKLADVRAKNQAARHLATLLSVDNRWFYLFSLVAMASLVALAMFDRRHEVRRMLNGGKARAMGLSKLLIVALGVLAAVTLTVFIFGDSLYRVLLQVASGEDQTELDKIAAENGEIKKQAEQAAGSEQAAAESHDRAWKKWTEWVESSSPPTADLPQQCQKACQRVREIDVSLHVQRAAAEQLASDVRQLEELQKEVTDNAAEIRSSRRKRQWICGGLGLGLVGLVVAGSASFRRGVQRRRKKTADTCPLCLGQGTLETAEDPRAASSGNALVTCNADTDYGKCEFTFPAMYREVDKVCFPTLGIPRSGKTHWLAMVYRELNRGKYPKLVQFERIRSHISDEFDQVVDEILNKKLNTAATQVQHIPHPLVFNFLDRDPLQVSNVLVNIFDYSGEVIQRMTLEDQQRRRALDGDGFFFFLDPTEPSESQAEALAGFREDVRQIKGVRAGRQLQTPVALCVSKIDLMINEPYGDPGGEGVIGNFYRDLGNIGWEMSLEAIRKRSELVAQLRDTVWPGWQIERQIDELFGGRVMFFPLTPVGLDEPGEIDLTRRTIAPLGLLDPLMWLLHMNGYPVLP